MNEKMHEEKMRRAIYYAKKAAEAGEVPVGAIVVDPQGKIIGRGRNRREEKQNVIEHAELMALQQAQRKIGSWRLEDCDLYVTLEPCLMCSGAIIQSRIRHVYFGAYDPKAGAVCSVTQMLDVPQWNHHSLYTGGILEEDCSLMLKDFFRKRRLENKEKKRLARQNKQVQTGNDVPCACCLKQNEHQENTEDQCEKSTDTSCRQ